MNERALRKLPGIDRLLELYEVRGLVQRWGRVVVVDAARSAVRSVREAILSGVAQEAPDPEDWVTRIGEIVLRHVAPAPRRVINATGVVIHTNLGRAPLGGGAVEALTRVAAGYCDLEYDLAAGQRGSRHGHAREALRAVTGAEDALVANNNAAAVLLATSALAAGGEVVVSRGELVEIGGSFRIPDVIVQGGAQLRAIGATNRTRLSDYEAAIGPQTRLLLKVHQSNFVQRGFTESVEARELVELGQRHGVPVMEDLGSGCLVDLRRHGLAHEPTVQEALAAGCDLVSFSGDKLVGGPQAGIVVGRAELLDRLRRHPLMRAVRPCKLTLAALVATLGSYRSERATEEVPVLRALLTPLGAAEVRAEGFARRLRGALKKNATGVCIECVQGEAPVGGGALPGQLRPVALVTVDARGAGRSAARVERALRLGGDPPVIARIVDGRLVLDLRCVAASDEAALLGRVLSAAARAA